MEYRYILIIGLILGSAVAAFGSTHPYISDPGTLLEGFENVNDWAVYGAGATAEDDTSFFKQGTQSIKVNAVNGTSSYITKTVSLDFSTGNYFSLWFYLTDITKSDYIQILMSSTTNFSKYFWKRYYTIGGCILNGWNRVGIYKSDFGNSDGDSWDNTMVRIRFQIKPVAGENLSIYFDKFDFGQEGQPKVIMTFDDDFVSQIDKAYPIMSSNGQAGVAFTYVNAVGVDGKMTLADLQTLQSAGWDISNHGEAHLHLADVSQEAMETDIDDGYDWLMANGFGNTAKFFAYPYGLHNNNVITKLKERHVLARGGLYAGHFDIFNFNDLQYRLGCVAVENDVAVATIQSKIDETIQSGNLLILMLHDIVDENADAASKYLTADFQIISDYLKTKQDAGLLEVITFSDYYNALIEWPRAEPFCVIRPAMDFNGDCKVDFADFALFTQSWLECNLAPRSACWE